MKMFLLALLLLGFAHLAEAVTCRIKGGAENTYVGYDVILKDNGKLEVVTQGAGWELTYDHVQSNSITKYFSYEDKVVVYEMERLSLYDYFSHTYYFQSEYCVLSVEPKKSPPPSGYVPPNFFPNAPPPVISGGYNGPVVQFTPRRQIMNPRIHGIACDNDDYSTHCDLDKYYVVLNANTAELTVKQTGAQYMLQKANLNGGSCSWIGGYCESLYRADGAPFSIGRGTTDGVNLYIIGTTTDLHFYEFPHDW